MSPNASIPDPSAKRWTLKPSPWRQERWVRTFGPYRLVVEKDPHPGTMPNYGSWCARLQGYGTLVARDPFFGDRIWYHKTRKEAQQAAMTWARRALKNRIERIQKIGRSLGCKIGSDKIKSTLMEG